MGKRWFLLMAALMGGLALLAAACAPASEPAQTTTTTTQPATTQQQTTAKTETKAAAEKPSGVVEQPAPKTTTQKATTAPASTTTKAAEAKPATSVSGIPLDPNAKFGGVLVQSYQTEGPTFSVWEEAHGNPYNVDHPLTNMIVRYRSWGSSKQDTLDGKYWEIYPDLAESWEQSADGLRWTFRFREGPTHADGSNRVPFTCRDAKWSLDTIRTGQGLRRSPRAIHFTAIDSIQCADDRTMVITMKRPKAGLLEMVAMPYHIVFPAYKYENNIKELQEKPPIGTGPFVLKQWIPGEKYVMERRSDYWDKPFPYLDGMELLLLSPSGEAVAQRAGRIDVRWYGGYWGGAQAETLIKECNVCEVWPRVTNVGFSAIEINHQRPPWNSQEVMDAMSLGFDRTRAVQILAQGWGVVPICGPLHPGTQWCSAEMQQRMKTVPGYNFATPKENQERARQILAAAGFGPGELKVKYRHITTSGAPVTFQEDMQAVGIEVEFVASEVAVQYDALSSGDFDLIQGGYWVAGTDPDVPLYEHFYTGSDRNYGRYSNPEVDRLMDQMSQTTDIELRKQRAWDVTETVMREHGKLIGYISDYANIYSKRMRNIIAAPASQGYGAMNRYDHVWLATN